MSTLAAMKEAVDKILEEERNLLGRNKRLDLEVKVKNKIVLDIEDKIKDLENKKKNVELEIVKERQSVVNEITESQSQAKSLLDHAKVEDKKVREERSQLEREKFDFESDKKKQDKLVSDTNTKLDLIAELVKQIA